MRTCSTPSIVIIGLAVLTSVGCTTVGRGVATNLAAIPRDRALVLFSTDGNRFIVSGRYQQRDIDFFLAKNPLLKSTDLVIQPLRFATRDDMPTSDDFVIKGTIWGVR